MVCGIRRALAVLGSAVMAVALTVTPVAAQAKLKIVATTGMIGDAVKQVGGDRVEVTSLMGPGVDPHTYRQTRSDIAAMTQADAVFWHGLYLEAQLEEFFKELAKHKTVVALAEALPKDKLLSNADYPGRYDPHVWMDPRLWKDVVVAARDQLIKLDPKGEPTFRANTDKYLAEIDVLAGYADKALSTVPQASRVLITAHDAFNYFGKAYGYEVLGIQGISTESEAGLKQVEDLVKVLVDKKIKAVFVESSVSDRNMRALIEGAAAKGQKVGIGGELFSDAMGAPGTYEGTYIGMIDHNTTTITHALGGQAPLNGMNGKLSGS